MFECLLENLSIPTSDIQERSEGAAFLRVAREAYPLKSLIYLGLNIPIGERRNQFIHCAFADSWAKQCVSRAHASLEHLGLANIFRQEVGWRDICELGACVLLDRAAADRIDGVGFPIPCSRGENAAFIILADSAGSDWAKQKPLIVRDFRPLANYFHQHMLRIFGHDVSGELLITAREIECLRWMAAGKTAWEVSIILGISERTVRFHLNAAREKLSCATTTQAVAKALSQQLFVL